MRRNTVDFKIRIVRILQSLTKVQYYYSVIPMHFSQFLGKAHIFKVPKIMEAIHFHSDPYY